MTEKNSTEREGEGADARSARDGGHERDQSPLNSQENSECVVLSSAARRMRRTRERRRAGVMWLPIEANEIVVDRLVVRGWLARELADDQAAICRALERMLQELRPLEFERSGSRHIAMVSAVRRET